MPDLPQSWRFIFLIAVIAAVYMIIRQSSSSNNNGPKKVLGSGAMFDQIAPYYDLANRFMSLGLDMRWRRELVSELQLSNDDYILDIATGTGDVAILIGTALKQSQVTNHQIIGLDPSGQMLSFAAEKIRNHKLENIISLVQDDSQDMSRFSNGIFTKISMSFGIRNVPNRLMAIKEMKRVLKSNSKKSRLVIMEFTLPKDTLLAPLVKTFINYAIIFVGITVARGSYEEYNHLRKSVFEFPAPEEFLQLFYQAGFTKCHYKNIFFGVVYLHICEE